MKSYRPISLLSVLAKILERVVRARLLDHLSNEHIIPDVQFGFRHGHSTTHQVLRLVKNIKDGFQRGESTGLLLLDLTSAFDTVWHAALVHKMRLTRFPIYLIKIIASFLKDRTFRVRVNRTLSSSKGIPAGLPQGSSLSPDLFNVYTYDLPQDQGFKVGAFADDTAIWHTAKRAGTVRRFVQDGCNRFSRYFRDWRLRQNPTKAVAAFFTRRRAERAFPKRGIDIDGQEVIWGDHAKYLGVTLDRLLTFKTHTEQVIQRTGACIRMLYSMLCRSSLLHERNKILLFKTTLRPSYTYASPSWTRTLAFSHFRKLQVFQNRCLRMCLDKPYRYHTRDLHDEARVPLLADYVCRLNHAFDQRSRMSCNSLISDLFDPHSSTPPNVSTPHISI